MKRTLVTVAMIAAMASVAAADVVWCLYETSGGVTKRSTNGCHDTSAQCHRDADEGTVNIARFNAVVGERAGLIDVTYECRPEQVK